MHTYTYIEQYFIYRLIYRLMKNNLTTDNKDSLHKIKIKNIAKIKLRCYSYLKLRRSKAVVFVRVVDFLERVSFSSRAFKKSSKPG